jgi:membrane-associated phospholipid phosphatase
MQPKKRLQGFFELISMFGEGVVPVFVLCVMFNLTHKMSMLYMWSAFGLVAYLNSSIFKALYAQPRPYMVSMDIKPSVCRPDFGNPSGHCMVSSFFWITCYLHQYYEVGVKRQRMAVFCTAYIIKMVATVALIVFLMFLALSRVFLGEHSYNQVLFGLEIGTLFAFILHFFVKQWVKDYPKKFS